MADQMRFRLHKILGSSHYFLSSWVHFIYNTLVKLYGFHFSCVMTLFITQSSAADVSHSRDYCFSMADVLLRLLSIDYARFFSFSFIITDDFSFDLFQHSWRSRFRRKLWMRRFSQRRSIREDIIPHAFRSVNAFEQPLIFSRHLSMPRWWYLLAPLFFLLARYYHFFCTDGQATVWHLLPLISPLLSSTGNAAARSWQFRLHSSRAFYLEYFRDASMPA